MPRVTVEVDDRERKPLTFPTHLRVRTGGKGIATYEIVVRDAHLSAGDYRLAEYPRAGLCERKGGLQELAQNLYSADRVRFNRAHARLHSAASYPFWLVECSSADLLRPPPHGTAKHGDVWDGFSKLCLAHGTPMIFCPASSPRQKSQAGELVVRALIQAALLWEKDHASS